MANSQYAADSIWKHLLRLLNKLKPWNPFLFCVCVRLQLDLFMNLSYRYYICISGYCFFLEPCLTICTVTVQIGCMDMD